MGQGWKVRTPLMVPALYLSESVSREVNVPLADFIMAASAAGFTASIAAFKMQAGSVVGLNFINTSPASVLGFILQMPQDIALSGKASGSGTVYVDWTSTNGADVNAVVAASVIWLPTACLFTGGCQLGAGCTLMASGKACQLTSTSLFQFKSPPNRAGQLKVLFRRCAGDEADTAQSVFCLFNMRLRYKADRLGS